MTAQTARQRLGHAADVIAIVAFHALAFAAVVLHLPRAPEALVILPDPPSLTAPGQPTKPEPLLWRTRVLIVAADADTMRVDVLGRHDTQPIDVPTDGIPAWVAALHPGDRVWTMADTAPDATGDRVIAKWLPREPYLDADYTFPPLTEQRVEAIQAELGRRVNLDANDYIVDLIQRGELMFVLRYDRWGVADRLELGNGTILTRCQDNTWDALPVPAAEGAAS